MKQLNMGIFLTWETTTIVSTDLLDNFIKIFFFGIKLKSGDFKIMIKAEIIDKKE